MIADKDRKWVKEPATAQAHGGTARGGSTPRRSATPCWPPPGTLDPSRPPGSPAKDLKVMELRNNGPEARARRGGPPAAAPQRLPAAAPRPDAAVAGGLRFRRAGDGHRQPRHDHGAAARRCTCSTTRSCRQQALALASGCAGRRTGRRARASSAAYAADARPGGDDAAEVERARAAYLSRLPTDAEAKPVSKSRIATDTPRSGGVDELLPGDAGVGGIPIRAVNRERRVGQFVQAIRVPRTRSHIQDISLSRP